MIEFYPTAPGLWWGRLDCCVEEGPWGWWDVRDHFEEYLDRPRHAWPAGDSLPCRSGYFLSDIQWDPDVSPIAVACEGEA